MNHSTMNDAEAALRTAIDSNDTDTITRLEPIIDDLNRAARKPDASLHAAALWYAQQGFHIFPLTPGSKIPFPRTHGCLDATTDAEQVAEWWTRNPDANIGLATGHLVDVVDIDGAVGQESRVKHWAQIFERIDADALGKVLTPRKGGMHIYVPATGEGNSTNIVPSVDYRGIGGYVVAPPSVTEVGRYRWLGTADFSRLTKGAAA